MQTKFRSLLPEHGYMTTLRSKPYQIISSPDFWANLAVTGSSSAACRGTKKRKALWPEGFGWISPARNFVLDLDYH